MKRKAHSVTASDIKQFYQLYKHGHTLRAIAEQTGWSSECIRTNLKKHGVRLHGFGKRREII